MNLTFKKVYTVTKKAEKPRLFLQHVVCESAGLVPGEPIYINVNEDEEEITLQNYPFNDLKDIHTVHVASRKSRVSGEERPLLDTAGERYNFLDVKQKVEVNVFRKGSKSKIVIRPLRYSLFNNETIATPKDERIRLLSICAGAGIGTASMIDTQYYSGVQEIEYEEDSAEVLRHNFPNSFVFNGDLRDCMQVAEADVVIATPPCNEFSNLGFGSGNVMNNLTLAVAKIIKASKASVLFFENVPSYYKSSEWFTLKQLLLDEYPYWAEKNIESWDFGNISTRNRTYAVGFKSEEAFFEFEFPSPPSRLRRRKLKDFLDRADVQHEWKSLDKWMESFNSREAWKERSLERTFVTSDVKRISCIPSRYTAHSASSSYVLNEKNKKEWRFLSIEEIRRILNVPEWFEFPKHTQKIRKYELLGQSVCGTVIRAIANKIAYVFMKTKTSVSNTTKRAIEGITINQGGQLALII